MAKRPEWAKLRRYKIVTSEFKSCVSLWRRVSNTADDAGTVLKYPLRTVVVSPNGVNRSQFPECTRGIHAYRTKAYAFNRVNLFGGQRVITVYAEKWYGTGDKVRAKRVWVGSVVQKKEEV